MGAIHSPSMTPPTGRCGLQFARVRKGVIVLRRDAEDSWEASCPVGEACMLISRDGAVLCGFDSPEGT